MSIELRDELRARYVEGRDLDREWARDFSAGQRQKLAGTGHAMSDGSFPIVTAEDLANAIRLAGNAKDPAAARAHIVTRAKALGLSAKIPVSWTTRVKSDLREELRAKYGAATRVTAATSGTYTCPSCDCEMTGSMGSCPDCGCDSSGSPSTCPDCGMEMAGSATSGVMVAHQAKAHGGAYTAANASPEKAFVLHAESGRTIITTPLREVAAVNQGFTYMRGRYVEADVPNGNGALWTTADLQLGAPTVAGGPLNWLHQEQKIIGAITSGTLQPGREAADGKGAIGNHIVSDAVLWSFLFPNETRSIAAAARDGQAYYSMECLSRAVACVGAGGCGEEFDYADYNAGNACTHLKSRSSTRRFVDPYFLGGAVIVPPVKPGWANAGLTVLSNQDRLAVEAAGLEEHLNSRQAASMVTAILQWANR